MGRGPEAREEAIDHIASKVPSLSRLSIISKLVLINNASIPKSSLCSSGVLSCLRVNYMFERKRGVSDGIFTNLS